MLEMRYCVDRAQWNETQPIVGVGLINVTGLQHGHRYSFRVVAMNGVPDSVGKTRSDPHTVIMAEGTHAPIQFQQAVRVATQYSPAPLLPQALRAPPSRRNVAVLSHAEYVPTLTTAAALCVKAALSKAVW